MAQLEDVWRRKTDDTLRAAAARLQEYGEDAQRVITAEIERRQSAEYLRSRASGAAAPPARAQRRADLPPAYANSPVWLAQRGLLAVGLMIGFYLFALTIALALLSVPYAEATYIGRIHLKLTAVCVLAGLAILWSLVPRIDRFTPPGPRLDQSAHPRLFDLIRRVAKATGQTSPSEVYLLNEVNAWVTHRGGVMGFGSRRVMGVGLPLMQVVTVPEFEAIIAHEFGHYCAGDVKLGPWIYKTRAAIGRTIAGLGDTSLVAVPFLWYGGHFLRLTHAISRQQEFIADRMAAGVAGAAAIGSALKRVATAGPLFSTYLNEEVAPVLNAGFLPPVSAGFNEFLSSDRIGALSAQLLANAEGAEETDPFDTHPCLGDRLAALDAGDNRQQSTVSTEPAAALIGDADAHVRALLEVVAGAEVIRNLKPIAWDAVGPTVYTARWREIVIRKATWLSRFTADSMPVGKDGFIRAGSDLVGVDEENPNRDERVARASQLLAAGLGVLLIDDGWTPHTRPGLPVTFARDSRNVDPFALVDALANGRLSSEAWQAECKALGIAGRPLARQTAPV
jgi:heat shock protein HtpX